MIAVYDKLIYFNEASKFTTSCVPQHVEISVSDAALLQEAAEIVTKRSWLHWFICPAGQNIRVLRQSTGCGFQIAKQVRCERDHALRSVAFRRLRDGGADKILD